MTAPSWPPYSIDVVYGVGPPGPAGPAGPQGAPGEPGRDATVFNWLGTLPSGPPAFNGDSPGDAWTAADTGDTWAWDGTQWTDVGTVRGPQGPPGEQGPPGADAQLLAWQGVVATGPPAGPGTTAGEAWTAADTGHVWAWDGTAWQDLGTIEGPPGEQGPPGADSDVPGPPGPAGPAGPPQWYSSRNGADTPLTSPGPAVFLAAMPCQQAVPYRLRGRFLLGQPSAGDGTAPVLTLNFTFTSPTTGSNYYFGSSRVFWAEHGTAVATAPMVTGNTAALLPGAPDFALSATAGAYRVVEVDGTVINNNASFTVQPAGSSPAGQPWSLLSGSYFEVMAVTSP